MADTRITPSPEQVRQAQYALRTYGGPYGHQLAADLDSQAQPAQQPAQSSGQGEGAQAQSTQGQ